MSRASRSTLGTALQVRHQAALRLVEAGELDGALALSLVVWPPKGSRLEDEAVPLGRQAYREDVKAEVRRRHAAGETLPALAASTGIPVRHMPRVVLGERAEAQGEPRAGASLGGFAVAPAAIHAAQVLRRPMPGRATPHAPAERNDDATLAAR